MPCPRLTHRVGPEHPALGRFRRDTIETSQTGALAPERSASAPEPSASAPQAVAPEPVASAPQAVASAPAPGARGEATPIQEGTVLPAGLNSASPVARAALALAIAAGALAGPLTGVAKVVAGVFKDTTWLKEGVQSACIGLLQLVLDRAAVALLQRIDSSGACADAYRVYRFLEGQRPKP